MSDIRINTEQVDSEGKKFHSKRGELETIHSAAKSTVSNLQSQWTGNRANKFFNDWETMQPSIRSAIETLQRSGDLLVQAAIDFGRVDNG